MNWLQKIAEPTGDCYKQALWWAADNGAELVHGMITNIYGQRFSHAWAEQGSQVIDVTTLGPDQPIDKAKWYKLVDAEVDARYPDAHKAMALGVREGHWGPWHE